MTESSYCMTNLPQFCNSCMLPRELCRCMWRYDNKLQEKVSVLETRLKELEEKIDDVIKLMVKEDSKLEDAAIRLEQKIDNLQRQINVVRASEAREFHTEKKPHKCPICGGKGGFMISGTIDEECHTCDAKGIVWG
jgi:hypothetical protein